jgi:hypothetical protein
MGELSIGWAGAAHEEAAQGTANQYQNVSMLTACAVLG